VVFYDKSPDTRTMLKSENSVNVIQPSEENICRVKYHKLRFRELCLFLRHRRHQAHCQGTTFVRSTKVSDAKANHHDSLRLISSLFLKGSTPPTRLFHTRCHAFGIEKIRLKGVCVPCLLHLGIFVELDTFRHKL
jgi:hypothetical protein